VTLENEQYGVKWLTCAKCGLTAPDVKKFGDKTECKDPTRCARVLAKEPLGGRKLEGKGPNDEP
jgi:hypothetical protein